MDNKVKVDVVARNKVIEELGLKTKEGIFQVENTKFMLNVEVEGEFYPVRIDIVFPKIKPEDTLQTAEDFADDYTRRVAEKEEKAKAKAEAKAKKIARDEKLRAKKKAEKEKQE